MFWVEALPRYADRQQRWADFWAVLAGVVAAVTGLAVWPVTQGADDPNRWLISAGALATAICALFPRILNYGELAGQARALTSDYGAVLGDLEDIVYTPDFDQPTARAVVKHFEETKQRKDALRGLPDKEKTLLGRRDILEALARARRDMEANLAAAATASAGHPAP